MTQNRQSQIANLQWFNELPQKDAVQQLIQCCGSLRWAERVADQRPYEDLEALTQASDDIWLKLRKEDWLEAFRAHPKIGEKKAATAGTARAESWSASEQSGVNKVDQQTAESLDQLNVDYEQKFGFIFIVCASGKSSSEMLDLLVERLHNDLNKELLIAAGEQAKITRLRLAKLMSAD